LRSERRGKQKRDDPFFSDLLLTKRKKEHKEAEKVWIDVQNASETYFFLHSIPTQKSLLKNFQHIVERVSTTTLIFFFGDRLSWWDEDVYVSQSKVILQIEEVDKSLMIKSIKKCD
jgi:hypothetical protein